MRGVRAKQLRRVANSMCEAQFRNEVIIRPVVRNMMVADPVSVLGFKKIEVKTNLRQHHPKSFHNLVQVLKKSYRRYIKDGSPVEKMVMA